MLHTQLINKTVTTLEEKGYLVQFNPEEGIITTFNTVGDWRKSFKISVLELNEELFDTMIDYIEERVHISETLYRR